ncbi:MAG: hypothetical protein NTZ02_00975 [Candidatus Woesearchaeota archaeon]|nr:hypothetical protein [Candidatus Woesearchaeota archaeon]
MAEDVNFEDVGKKIEEVNAGVERLESILMSEYYDIVKQNKLYDTEHAFTDELKDKLVDNIAKALKEQLIHTRPGYEGISDYVFEDSVMQMFFGINKNALKHFFKDKKRVTADDIGKLVGSISQDYSQSMHMKALEKIGPEHLDAGREYLKKISAQYKIPFKPESVRESKELMDALLKTHSIAYQYKLRDKYA